jgi:hypothetical protein
LRLSCYSFGWKSEDKEESLRVQLTTQHHYTGKYGSIGYNCTAVIDRPGLLKFNKTVEAVIRVVGQTNIDRPLMQQPLIVCASASVGFMRRGLVAIQVIGL